MRYREFLRTTIQQNMCKLLLLISWDIPTQGISCKVHIEEMHSFLQHFDTHSFQINFRVLHNLKGVFRTISNIYDEAFSQKYLTAFSRAIFAEILHHRYFIGFCIRLCSLVFYIFPLSSFVYLNERYKHFVIIRKVCSYFPHMT